ncbi:MAG: pitrilysin family protein [Chloroflexi bacterium]|nr:pitrilysin family protein [Chloroflexota bacterium]
MFQRTVLDNQLRVLTSAMPHSTSVSITISVGAGSRYESDEMAGLSHFLEHLPFKGTKSWPTARHVSEAIEGVGGIMNASTDREVTVFWCKVARLHFNQAFAVLLDLVLNPILDPGEMEKEREVIQEELRMTYDYPSHRVDLLIDELLWPEQAMGRDVGGTLESVDNINLDQVRDYMMQQYNPSNTAIAVAGNIDHGEIVAMVNEATQHWQPRESLRWEPAVDYYGERGIGSIAKVEDRQSDQAHICLGLPGISLTDPDRYALAILNGVLGDGMSSRLFLNLREEQGLAYDVSSSLNHFRDCGSLVVYCGVEPRKTQEAVRAVIHDLAGMREPVPDAELNKSREFTKGRLLLRMEDTRSVAAWLGAQELLLGKVSTIDETVEEIDRVTSEDIANVAERLLDPNKLRLAVVGPQNKEKDLQALLNF